MSELANAQPATSNAPLVADDPLARSGSRRQSYYKDSAPTSPNDDVPGSPYLSILPALSLDGAHGAGIINSRSISAAAPAQAVLPEHGSIGRHRQDQHFSRTGSQHKRLRLAASSHLQPLVFQPSLDLRPICYKSLLVRALYYISPFCYLAKIVVILFLDYTALYALAQIAKHPGPEAGPAYSHISGRPLADPWWIVFGFYAAASAIWLLGVVLIYEIYSGYFVVWRSSK